MEPKKASKAKKALWLLVGISIVVVFILLGLLIYNYFDKKYRNIELSAFSSKEQYVENEVAELRFSYEENKKIEYIFIELEYGSGLEFVEIVKDETEEYLYSKVEQKDNKFYFYFDEPSVMGCLGNYKFKINDIDSDLSVGIKKGYVKYVDGTFSIVENEGITLNSNNGGSLYICSKNENYYNYNIIKNNYYSFTDKPENYQDCKKSNIVFEKGYSIINDIETKEIVVLIKNSIMYFYNINEEKFTYEFELPPYYLFVDSLYIDSNTGYTYGFSLVFNNLNVENSIPKEIYYDLNNGNSFEMKFDTVPTVASSPNIVKTQSNKFAYSHLYENFEEKIGIYDLNNDKIIVPNKYDAINYNIIDNSDGYYVATKKGEYDKIYFTKTKELIEMPAHYYWIIDHDVLSYAQNEKIYISSINNINKNYLLVIDDINYYEIQYINFVNYDNEEKQYDMSSEKTNFIYISTEKFCRIYDIQSKQIVFTQFHGD